MLLCERDVNRTLMMQAYACVSCSRRTSTKFSVTVRVGLLCGVHICAYLLGVGTSEVTHLVTNISAIYTSELTVRSSAVCCSDQLIQYSALSPLT